jgi:Tfp pilus assembly protein PilV
MTLEFIKQQEDQPAAGRRFAVCQSPATAVEDRQNQQGFSLLEGIIALLLMMIVGLGSANLFVYSIYNGSAGTDRAAAIAMAQEALEVLRSAQFNSTTTDPVLNVGTTVQSGVVRDLRKFTLTVTVTDISTTLKSITVTVVPESIGKGWTSGAGRTITLITQRSKTDR